MVHLIALLSLAGVFAADASRAVPDTAGRDLFEKRIRPLLARRCYGCHSSRATRLKAGLRLDSRAAMLEGGGRGPSIVPGKPEESLLVKALRRVDPDLEMPPDGPLGERDVADVERWIRAGAPWPETPVAAAGGDRPDDPDPPGGVERWAFQPIVRHSPPRVGQVDWPLNAIDHFILEKLEAAGVPPAPPADRGLLLRRVYFDLIGLPPTPGEIDAFLADEAPGAYEKVVDRLLASPRHGERWARHWLDLVRYAETAGNEFDYDILFAWRYRDYVVRALNGDLPYDRFVVEHVAGDLLGEAERRRLDGADESTLGTGFYWLGQAMQSPIDVLEAEYETIENQIDVLSKTFLGLTVACARCHDHKFDPVSTDDYYALAGYLRSSRRQFAFIDPPETTREVVGRIRALDSSRGELLREWVHERLSRSAGRLAARLLEPSSGDPLVGSLESARSDALDLFHPWTVLSAAESRESFASKRRELLDAYDRDWRRPEGGRSSEIVFEDFAAETRGAWTRTGAAFEESPAGGVGLIVGDSVERPIQRLLPAGVAHSGSVSGRLRGGLRSRTFRIERPFIDYRAARTASVPTVPKIDPGDLKDGQIHLILDGFHLIRQPIYEGLSIDVATGGGLQWYRQDVGKWVGHRAYIEITDEDNGIIIVDRIRFSEGPPPAVAPNRIVLDLLEDDSVDSREALARGYQEILLGALARWKSGSLAASPHGSEWVEVAGRALDVGLDDGLDDGLDGLDAGASAAATGEGSTAAAAVADYLAARRSLEARIAAPHRGLSMLDGTGEDAHVLIRGSHRKPGRIIPRRFLDVLGGGGAASREGGSGRLALAGRMIAGDNPLLARVMVNRIWHHHFGRGIVPTPDDFGAMGQPPSHPELLDFLAAEFARGGWSLKRLHRSIVTSRTYRMASRADAAAERLDPDNRLFHRMPVRRLEGEIIRDAALAISGRLEAKMEGPSVLPYLTEFMEGRGRPSDAGPLDGDGRRSLYISVRRNFLTPAFLVFDYPVPESTTGRRAVSNVPAQALTLLNNPLFVQEARRWAERVLREAPSDTAERIRRLYRMAFARPPTELELEAATDFIGSHGASGGNTEDVRVWADLCHVLMNVREFIFIR